MEKLASNQATRNEQKKLAAYLRNKDRHGGLTDAERGALQQVDSYTYLPRYENQTLPWKNNKGGSRAKTGDFTNLEGSTVDDILDRIPDEAILRELYPVQGGATDGFEFKWVQNGQTYRVRVHNADPGAPVGSNASN